MTKQKWNERVCYSNTKSSPHQDLTVSETRLSSNDKRDKILIRESLHQETLYELALHKMSYMLRKAVYDVFRRER